VTFILGINAYHGDSSACLVADGRLVAAAEEERFRRLKHWAGLPSEAVRYCLAEAGIGLESVDVLALNTNPRAALMQKAAYALRHRPEPAYVLSRLRNMGQRRAVADELSRALGQPFKGRLEMVEHHLAHLSSAFHVSPFAEAVVVSVDGFGDFASAAWGVGRGSDIRVDGRVHFPHSLGVFYQAMTQYLGFPHYGDEYKMMGLAPYGRPAYLDAMRQIVRLKPDGRYELDLCFFRHHRERFQYAWDGGQPLVGPLFTPALEELLGPARNKDRPLEQRHKDLACSAQAMYEEAFFHLLNTLHTRYRLDCLALAGGCAMNSVANGKVTRRTPFKRLYVQSAAGDAGGAIGAAFSVWYARVPHPSPLPASGERGRGRFFMDHAYWGPQTMPKEMRQFVDGQRTAITSAGCHIEEMVDEVELCRRTAAAIADGQVVGWFQGRMEWGPRALGNRSIVCDPRRADMKDILNRKIKRRESFRPFAPSILREAVPEWFEVDDDEPFMMKVFPIREDKRAQIPAVTHVDGSGRLQTVYPHTNSRYYRLIEAFRDLTGVPMVLNTSFNENEPVVCRPQEALDCFLRTKMDMLVLGDWMVTRIRRGD
jgi:carbamoyltransferase